MTRQELNARIEFYKKALHARQITAREWEGFMEALCKLAQQ